MLVVWYIILHNNDLQNQCYDQQKHVLATCSFILVCFFYGVRIFHNNGLQNQNYDQQCALTQNSISLEGVTMLVPWPFRFSFCVSHL